MAIFSTGAIFDEVAAACELLKEQGVVPTVYTFPTVKPLDRETVLSCAAGHRLIVTCEEHNIVGGFGSAVAEVMAEESGKARLLRVGMADQYCSQVGNQKYLRAQYGMDGQTIARRIVEALK